MEDRIRRKRPEEFPLFPQSRNRWGNDLDFFTAKISVFAGMGVQSRHGDTRIFNTTHREEMTQQLTYPHDLICG